MNNEKCVKMIDTSRKNCYHRKASRSGQVCKCRIGYLNPASIYEEVSP